MYNVFEKEKKTSEGFFTTFIYKENLKHFHW